MSDLDKFNYECEGQLSIFKENESGMDALTTEMMEHICDHLCRFPRDMEQEELDEHCCECRMGQYVRDILNEYNRINDFEKTQCCKLLKKLQKAEQALKKNNEA